MNLTAIHTDFAIFKINNELMIKAKKKTQNLVLLRDSLQDVSCCHRVLWVIFSSPLHSSLPSLFLPSLFSSFLPAAELSAGLSRPLSPFVFQPLFCALLPSLSQVALKEKKRKHQLNVLSEWQKSTNRTKFEDEGRCYIYFTSNNSRKTST